MAFESRVVAADPSQYKTPLLAVLVTEHDVLSRKIADDDRRLDRFAPHENVALQFERHFELRPCGGKTRGP